MTNCANSVYGQDTTAKSSQRHVYPPSFVQILKVETGTAVDDVSIKMSTSRHTGGTATENAAQLYSEDAATLQAGL